MSISKVHELIQNKGCVWTVSILMILSMVVGSFAMCGRVDRYNNSAEQGPATVVGTVAGHDITDRLVESELKKGAQMYGGITNLPPNFVIQIQAGALRGIVGNILQLEMAKKYGIVPTDEQIEKLINENIDQELGSQKQQFIMQGKLKETATEAEFAEAFKKEFKQDLSDVKKRLKEANAELLKQGPDLRIPLAAMTIGQPLMAAIKQEVKLSDDELKKTYNTFEFQRITLQKGNPSDTAKKVLADLKGGLSFEKAMDRYDEAPRDPKKKPSEKTEPMPLITLRGFEAYQPLENLKPGEVSQPITIGQSVNIFKLLKIKNELPKDFDKKKDTYRDTQLTSLAAGKLQKDLMAAQKNAVVEWKNDAYRLLYEFGRISSENLPSEERIASEKKLLDEAVKVATEGEAYQSRIAGTLAYVVLQSAETKATPAEKKKLEENKLKVYEVYLMDNEDPALRLELAQIYKDKKDKEKFFGELLAAAEANSSQVDITGQGIYNKITGLLKQGQDANLVTAEETKQIQTVLDEWKRNKADQDKWDAEAKKEADKQAAEAKKAQEKAKSMDNVKTRTESEKEKASGGKK